MSCSATSRIVANRELLDIRRTFVYGLPWDGVVLNSVFLRTLRQFLLKIKLDTDTSLQRTAKLTQADGIWSVELPCDQLAAVSM